MMHAYFFSLGTILDMTLDLEVDGFLVELLANEENA